MTATATKTKKTKPQQPENHPITTQQPSVSTKTVPTVSEACRMALADVGIDCSAKQLRAWIAEHAAGVRYNDKTLSSTLSAIRKTMNGHSKQREPSVEELVKVRKMAEQYGGSAALSQLLETVNATANEVGGIPRLIACLDGLKLLEVE